MGHQHHEELIEGLAAQLAVVFSQSEQGVYVYLDDVHKACNRRFASMLGYGSPEKWAAVEDSFPKFVADGSQRTLISAYRGAMEKMAGSTIEVTWNRKSGGTVKTKVILVPIAYEGHLFALHFVSRK